MTAIHFIVYSIYSPCKISCCSVLPIIQWFGELGSRGPSYQIMFWVWVLRSRCIFIPLLVRLLVQKSRFVHNWLANQQRSNDLISWWRSLVSNIRSGSLQIAIIWSMIIGITESLSNVVMFDLNVWKSFLQRSGTAPFNNSKHYLTQTQIPALSSHFKAAFFMTHFTLFYF